MVLLNNIVFQIWNMKWLFYGIFNSFNKWHEFHLAEGGWTDSDSTFPKSDSDLEASQFGTIRNSPIRTHSDSVGFRFLLFWSPPAESFRLRTSDLSDSDLVGFGLGRIRTRSDSDLTGFGLPLIRTLSLPSPLTP